MNKLAIKIKTFILNFNNEPDWFKFGVLVAICSVPISIYCSTLSFRLYHYKFFLTTPLFSFFTFRYFWKGWFKNQKIYTYSGILIISTLATIVTHYLSFVVEEIILDSYRLLISEQSFREYIWNTVIVIIGGFYLALISIREMYFSTIFIPFIIGFYIKKTFANNE